MGVLEVISKAVEGDKEKEQSGSSGWIGSLVAGILVIIITAIFGFIAWKRGKELAKLLHEKALREEEEHQAKVDAKIAQHEDARQEALQRAAEARKTLEQLEQERQQIEEEHREVRARIDAITSWDAVDSFLDGGS